MATQQDTRIDTQNDKLFADNPLWGLIVGSQSFKELKRSTIDVMLTEIEHAYLTINTAVALGQVDQATAEARQCKLAEQTRVLNGKLHEMENDNDDDDDRSSA